MATLFITAETVAALVGLVSGPGFLAQRGRLEADCAFPRPMPTSRRPLRWRRDEVEAWVARQGLPEAPPLHLPQGSNIHLLHLARTA